MIHIRTIKDFRQRTAPLLDYEFENVTITPDTLIGLFHIDRLNELKAFCKNNPDYHIISVIDACLYFNKVTPHATKFLLAQGDPNPDLVCFEGHEFREILQRYSDESKLRA